MYIHIYVYIYIYIYIHIRVAYAVDGGAGQHRGFQGYGLSFYGFQVSAPRSSSATAAFRDFKDTDLSTLRVRYLVSRMCLCIVFGCLAILRIEGCLHSTL